MKDITRNPSLTSILKYIILVGGGIVIWSVLTFTSFFALRNLQMFLYKKPNEILYIGGGLFIFLFIAVLFVPISLYYLICNSFFPNYWKRASKNDYIPTRQMRLMDKFCVIVAVLSILGILLSFNRYIALGDGYIAFSQAGIIHKRQYYSYDDIRMELKKDESTNTYEPRFYLKDKILSMGFWDDNKLAKDIQEHRNRLAFNAPYIRVESTAQSRNSSFAHFISIAIMGIGIGLFSRIFVRKKKK